MPTQPLSIGGVAGTAENEGGDGFFVSTLAHDMRELRVQEVALDTRLHSCSCFAAILPQAYFWEPPRLSELLA